MQASARTLRPNCHQPVAQRPNACHKVFLVSHGRKRAAVVASCVLAVEAAVEVAAPARSIGNNIVPLSPRHTGVTVLSRPPSLDTNVLTPETSRHREADCDRMEDVLLRDTSGVNYLEDEGTIRLAFHSAGYKAPRLPDPAAPMEQLDTLIRNSKLNQAKEHKNQIGAALASLHSSSSSGSDEEAEAGAANLQQPRPAFNLNTLKEYRDNVLRKLAPTVQRVVDEAGCAFSEQQRREKLKGVLGGRRVASASGSAALPPPPTLEAVASACNEEDAEKLSEQLRVTVHHIEALEAKLKEAHIKVQRRHYGPRHAASTAPAPASTGSAAVEWWTALDTTRATSRLAVIVCALAEDCSAMEAALSELN